MWQDPIVAEVRRVREAYAEQFDFDLKAIYKALKDQEKQSHRRMVSFSPKRTFPVEETKQASSDRGTRERENGNTSLKDRQ